MTTYLYAILLLILLSSLDCTKCKSNELFSYEPDSVQFDLFSNEQNKKEIEDEVESEFVRFNHAPLSIKSRALILILKGFQCDDESNEILCNKKCSHFKLSRGNGCCRCNCQLGYAIDEDKTSCYKTEWEVWSPWSKCIKSDWGGLQRRERHCVAKKIIKNGRCHGEGSQARPCSEVKKHFRIRKNIRDLSDLEKHDLLQAFNKLKRDNSTYGYMHTIRFHGWPYMCPWNKMYQNHHDGHCGWHLHPLFLSWHRLITVQFELGLNRYLKDKSIGVPYWDWTEPDWFDIPDLVRLPLIVDPILKRRVKNPFYRTYVYDHPPYRNETLYNYRRVNKNGIHHHKLLLRSVIRSLLMPNYLALDYNIEGAHNQIHDCMCVPDEANGECEYSMQTTSYASFDPIFFLHHSQIDRVYALYKTIHERAGDQDWTKASFTEAYIEQYGRNLTRDIGEAFDWPLSPFCNDSINTNPVTFNPGVWTARNAFHYEQLFGYKYHSFNLGGHPWMGLVHDYKVKQRSHNNGLAASFVSTVAPSLGTITKSNTKYTTFCTVPE